MHSFPCPVTNWFLRPWIYLSPIKSVIAECTFDMILRLIWFDVIFHLQTFPVSKEEQLHRPVSCFKSKYSFENKSASIFLKISISFFILTRSLSSKWIQQFNVIMTYYLQNLLPISDTLIFCYIFFIFPWRWPCRWSLQSPKSDKRSFWWKKIKRFVITRLNLSVLRWLLCF